MKQTMAYYRLSPRTINTQVCVSPSGELTVLAALCRAIHCYWPENPQFAAVVEPKVKAELLRLFRVLDAADAIALYKVPFTTGMAVWWPKYTRAWALPTWKGEVSGQVSKECRQMLNRVAFGGPVPAWATSEDEEEEDEHEHEEEEEGEREEAERDDDGREQDGDHASEGEQLGGDEEMAGGHLQQVCAFLLRPQPHSPHGMILLGQRRRD